jgi:hypothetical protein
LGSHKQRVGPSVGPGQSDAPPPMPERRGVAFVAEGGSAETDRPGATWLTRDRTVQGVCEGAPKRDLANLNINDNTSPLRVYAQREPPCRPPCLSTESATTS